MEPAFQSPFNTLPPVVVALAVIMAGLELLFQAAGLGLLGGAAGIGWRQSAMESFGVFDSVWQWMRTNNTWPWEHIRRFLTFPLLHAGFYHALFSVVFVLAMGNFVGRAFHPMAVLAVFWLSSIAGALGFVVFLNEGQPLVGGYPGAFGLIGAFTFLLWTQLVAQGENQNRAFSLIAMLMAIHLGFSLFSGNFGGFVSELCGFTMGFFLSFLVSPGGWSRVLGKLRNR